MLNFWAHSGECEGDKAEVPDPEPGLVVDLALSYASISWVGIVAVCNLKANLDNPLLRMIDGEWECDLPKYIPRYPSSSSFNYVAPEWCLSGCRISQSTGRVQQGQAGVYIHIYNVYIHVYMYLYIYIGTI